MIRVKKIIYIFTYFLTLAVGALICFLILSGLGKINVQGELTIKINDVTKTYDGSEIHSDGFQIVNGSLNNGDYVSINYTNGLTNVGSTKQNADVKIYSEDNSDVTKNYNLKVLNGTITVNKATIKIEVNKDLEYNNDYSSLDLTNVYTLSSGTLPTGAILYPYVDSKSTVQRASNIVVKCNVINQYSGENLTDNFEITGNNSIANFKKIPLTISANTKTKVYDGTSLSFTEDDIIVNGLYSSDTFNYKGTYNSITNVSQSGTKIKLDESSINILDSNKLNVTSSYQITILDSAALNITPRDIVVRTTSYSTTYSNVDEDSYKVIENIDELETLGITSDCFNFKTYENAGTYQNIVSLISSDYIDFNNFNITYNFGIVTISRLHVDVYLPTLTETVGSTVSKPSYSQIKYSIEDADIDISINSNAFKQYNEVGQYIYYATLDTIDNNYDVTIHPGYINIVE